jgi:hypothetical protein
MSIINIQHEQGDMSQSQGVYERVLATVEGETCGPSPTVVDKDRVMLRVTNNETDTEAVESAIRTALERGQLERAGGGYRPPGGCDC